MNLQTVLEQAPMREFKNKEKKRGLFQQELKELGFHKTDLKKLARKGEIKAGYVSLFDGVKIFYTLD